MLALRQLSNLCIMKLVAVLQFVCVLSLVQCLVNERRVKCDRYAGCRARPQTRTLYFGLMLSFPDTQERTSLASDSFDDGHDLAPAAYLAVKQVNNRSDILSDYDVQILRLDEGCGVLGRTVNGYSELVCSCEPIVGIIGPSCEKSSRRISQLTERENFSVISINYGGSDASVGNRSYAFGILGRSSVYNKATVQLMNHANWTNAALLYSERIGAAGMKLLQTVESISKFNISFSSALYENFIPLERVRNSFARVIILLALPLMRLRVLCLAYHERMVYPHYQWLFQQATDVEFHKTSFTHHGRFYHCSESDISASVYGSINLFLNALVMDNTVDTMVTDAGVTPQEYHKGYELQVKEYSNEFNVTSKPSDWAKGLYDAVWCLAFALNDSLVDLTNVNLTELNPGSVLLAQSIRKHMFNLDIIGTTGRIKFNNDTGFNRDGTVNVYQYGQNRTRTRIGSFEDNRFTPVPNASANFINPTFDVQFIHVGVGAAASLLAFTVLSLILVISAQVVNIYYRNRKTIKATSPTLNHFIFLGCYTIIIATVIHIIAESLDLEKIDSETIKINLCNSFPWLLSIGITLILGTVCVKTWRLHQIYSHSKRLNNENISCINGRFLGALVVGLVTIDIIICTVWRVTDPLVPTRTQWIHVESDDELPFMIVNEVCHSNLIVYWLILLLTPKVMLVSASFFLALSTHLNIKEFRTSNIIILAYFLAVLFGLGIPLYVVVRIIMDVAITISVVLLTLCLDIAVCICVVVLFLPSVYVLIRKNVSLN